MMNISVEFTNGWICFFLSVTVFKSSLQHQFNLIIFNNVCFFLDIKQTNLDYLDV